MTLTVGNGISDLKKACGTALFESLPQREDSDSEEEAIRETDMARKRKQMRQVVSPRCCVCSRIRYFASLPMFFFVVLDALRKSVLTC